MDSITQLYAKSQAYVVYSLHISVIFLTNYIDVGWLAERENQRNWKNRQPILTQWLVGVIASHGACIRMEKGNVTDSLRWLFPDSKGGSKIDQRYLLTLFLLEMVPNTEVYSLSNQTSTMELSAKLVNGSQK